MRYISIDRCNLRGNVRLRLLALMAAIGLAIPTGFAQPIPDLTSVREVRALRPEQAALGRPVRLRGVVTAISGWKSSFFFQDETSGVSIDRDSSAPDLHAGQLIEVVGVTQPGKFAPVVKANAVKILGTGNLPHAKLVGLAELFGGTLDSQWATIQGVVHRAEVKQIWGRDVLVLEMNIGGDTLVTARVRDFDRNRWQHLPASFISLRGVCATVFNDRRQFIALRFFVSNLDDLKVLHPGPADLFDRPLTELSNIGRFHPGSTGADLFRIQGVVTYMSGDGKIYVQNGSGAVLVRTNHEAGLIQGSEIEAVGFARDGDYSPSLEEAAFRPVKIDLQPVAPVSVNAAYIVLDQDGFVSSPYDSRLVRVKGLLQQAIPGSEDTVLFLRDGTTVFTARLQNSASPHPLPAVGSVVEMTGICVTRVDSSHEPKGFRILLRSISDIKVIKTAPWWSAEHAKTVVLIMAVAMVILVVILILIQRESNLRHLSLSDPLTGVHNRRGFLLLAGQQWRLALRKNVPMLIFYIDLDKFKEINDTLGHKQGDIALQTVADILRQCFRKSDVIGRIGGDEFAIVACEAAPDSQVELEERLKILVAQANQRLDGAFQLSLSVGILFCDASMSRLGVEDLLARTDTLMYEKKMNARNLPRHANTHSVI